MWNPDFRYISPTPSQVKTIDGPLWAKHEIRGRSAARNAAAPYATTQTCGSPRFAFHGRARIMKILGIDAGAVSGGCSIVLVNDGVVPQLIDAIDLPTIGVKAKQRIDVVKARQAGR